MPNYLYQCKECGHQLEAFHKIADEPLKKCPQCSENGLQKKPSSNVGLSFKGSGFYINDYAKNTCCPCDKSCSSSETKGK